MIYYKKYKTGGNPTVIYYNKYKIGSYYSQEQKVLPEFSEVLYIIEMKNNLLVDIFEVFHAKVSLL